MTQKNSKRIGGFERAKVARAELKEVFERPEHELYFSKDIDLAKKYDVTRHTIYKIRHDLNVPSRSKRIINKVKEMNTNEISLKEMAITLGVKYQNLYKLINDINTK